MERSGKRKTAGPGPSKREAVHAGDEHDSEEDEVESEPDEVEQEDSEVEPDDNEGEDDDNVELAPEPRKTYARLARRSRGVSAKADRKRHERRCLICRHPEREEIEDEFIRWQHPYDIGKAYEIDQRVVYRHARAVGLYARRTRNVRSALDSVLQNCYDAAVTGDTIVRAVRACTRITDDGRWIDPPSQVIVSSGSRIATPPPALPPQPAPQYMIDVATHTAPALAAPASSAVPVLPAAPATRNASGEGSSRKSRRGPRPKRRNSKRSSNRQRRPIRK